MQTIFLFYFLSPLSNYFSSPTITTTQRARINWKLTKHIYWKLTQNQQKINPNTSTQTNLHRDTLAKKKKNTERSELMGTISAWLEWSELVGMGLAWSVLVDRSCGDRCLPDRSCGSVLVTEMVWIRPRGRVDSEMGIEMEISGLERRCGACDGCGVDGL